MDVDNLPSDIEMFSVYVVRQFLCPADKSRFLWEIGKPRE